MPLLSIEDPAYLLKVFFRAPLACLGLARWLPVNVGDVARKYINDPELLNFIDIDIRKNYYNDGGDAFIMKYKK